MEEEDTRGHKKDTDVPEDRELTAMAERDTYRTVMAMDASGSARTDIAEKIHVAPRTIGRHLRLIRVVRTSSDDEEIALTLGCSTALVSRVRAYVREWDHEQRDRVDTESHIVHMDGMAQEFRESCQTPDPASLLGLNGLDMWPNPWNGSLDQAPILRLAADESFHLLVEHLSTLDLERKVNTAGRLLLECRSRADDFRAQVISTVHSTAPQVVALLLRALLRQSDHLRLGTDPMPSPTKVQSGDGHRVSVGAYTAEIADPVEADRVRDWLGVALPSIRDWPHVRRIEQSQAKLSAHLEDVRSALGSPDELTAVIRRTHCTACSP